MKHDTHCKTAALRLTALAAALASAGLHAAVADISQSPLTVANPSVVKPNVMFVLDDSGSMARDYAPDDVSAWANRYGQKTSQCNSIYFNPNITYVVPKNADGTNFANATFTAAKNDGFDSGSGTTNLNTSFKAHSGDTAQQAYYYNYTGSQTPNFLNTTNLFYRECNSTIGSNPGAGVFTKVTISSAHAQAQNFANWYTYYRTRMNMMKSGAGRAFSTITDRYRVGYMTINQVQTSTNTQFQNISDFNQAQKDLWYQKFYNAEPNGSTPLRVALSRIGRIYGGKIGNDPVQYSCQQNFTILTTDGYWNEDSNPVRLNGSTAIGDQDAALPRPEFQGTGSSVVSNTLADTAAYYYRTDLRDPSHTANCNTGVGVAPNNNVCTNNVPVSGLDNAPHQHMTTFTLGLGVNGSLRYSSDYLQGGSVDYNAIVAGTKNWPKPSADDLTTIDDLWHAAVNGHGQYFSAQNPDLLVTGLRTALAGVSAREAAGAAAATSNLEPVAGDNFAFVANYRTQKWDGNLEARTIDLTTGIFSDTAVWSAQELLDARVAASTDTRNIFTITSAGVGMRPFLPASFSAAEKTLYFTSTAAVPLTQAGGWSAADAAQATPDNLINYLRGQTQHESRGVNTFRLWRDREHVLGDIIHGKPVYVKKPPFNYSENAYQAFKTAQSGRQGAVYVAANDGMMHAFNSDTGQELWAYVPSFSWPKMKVLADADYANRHTYSTDGAPTLSDIYTGTAWKTILVAGMSGGGNGYYALDVTTPGSPTILWEFKDPNMGLSFGNPIVGKRADGTWIVAFTSGYNNADGVGRLYIVRADNGTLLDTISTGVGSAATPSNLGKISAWVDDGLNDNTIQRIYGGDMLGNVWRFDINNILPPAGKDAFKLATLQGPGAYVQPITTKPELGLVGNKAVVFVGTGRYLGTSDLGDLGQQSVYAIKDRLDATPLGIPRSTTPCTFVSQTLTALDANTRIITSNNAVDFDSTTTCGWYIDFNPGNQTPGERINIDMRLQLGVLALATNIPEQSVCNAGGSSFIYFFNYATGRNLGDFEEITDINSIPSTHAPNKVGERIGNSTAEGFNVIRLPDNRVVTIVTTSDDRHPVYGNPVNPTISGSPRRVLWRELLN